MLRPRLLLLVALAAAACPGSRTQPAAIVPEPLAPEPPADTPPSAAEPARVRPRGVDAAADGKLLADLVATRSWTLGRPAGVRVSDDGRFVLFLRAAGPRAPEQSLWRFDVATGEEQLVLSAEKLLAGGEEQLSAEERARRERMRAGKTRGLAGYQLLPGDGGVLTSLSGRVYLASLDGRSVVEVAGPDAKGNAPFDAHVSPDGKLVAFVRGGELWVAPAAGGGKARQLTRGAGGAILHAQAEFVAQEELDRYTGHWWSPDGKRLVYQETDESAVDVHYLVDPASPFAPAFEQRYPRPGKANASLRLGLVAAGGGKTTWIDWDRQRFPYLLDVHWKPGSPLTLLVTSRDQRDLELLVVDEKSGKSRTLLAEHDDAWVNPPLAYHWLEDGSGFLWASERDGAAWQLFLHAPDGKPVRALTPPELGLKALLQVDLAARALVVSGAAEPVDTRLWRISLDGGSPEPLSPAGVVTTAIYARKSGTHHRVQYDERGESAATVVRADGSVAGTLRDLAEPAPLTPAPEIRKLGGFWTATVRPRDFDPGKKYPVLLDVYGGPHFTMVHRARKGYILKQFLADHGFIVVSVDGRGTPGRGRDWERVIKHDFAGVTLADQVAGLQALAAAEPAMDMTRVGVSGWSFGGYMAALAVMDRPDVFACAIAGAPVTDWLDYDTAYTERYLGIPDLKGDLGVYERSGLLSRADKLGRPLLIIHGTVDDNVHFLHALKLADALFAAGKRFELLPLAGETHSPRDPARMLRLYQRELDFLAEHLSD